MAAFRSADTPPPTRTRKSRKNPARASRVSPVVRERASERATQASAKNARWHATRMIRRKLAPAGTRRYQPSSTPRITSRIHSRARDGSLSLSGFLSSFAMKPLFAVFLAFSTVSRNSSQLQLFSSRDLATDHERDSIRIRVSCRNALNIAARRFSLSLSLSRSLVVCILIRGARSRADYGQMKLLTRTAGERGPSMYKRVRERTLIKYYIREGFIRRE